MPGIRYVEQNLFLADVMLDKIYSRHRLCSTKPIPGIRYVGQTTYYWTKPMPGINLCLAYVMLDKTYSRHRLCSKKPIPGICYLGQTTYWT